MVARVSGADNFLDQDARLLGSRLWSSLRAPCEPAPDDLGHDLPGSKLPSPFPL